MFYPPLYVRCIIIKNAVTQSKALLSWVKFGGLVSRMEIIIMQIDLQIEKVHRVPLKFNEKKATPRHILVIFFNWKDT